VNLLHRLQLRVYLFWAVVVGFILLSALMVWPFVSAIISAYILAFLVRPLSVRLRPRFGRTGSALICIALVILLIIVPVTFIALQLMDQVGEVSRGHGIADILATSAAQPLLHSLNIDPNGLKEWLVVTTNNIINSAIQSIPSFAIGLVITVNAMFYLLRNWGDLAIHLNRYLPFKNNEKIITELGRTADAIIRGHGMVSALEAVIAFIGFTLVGVQASLIFSVLIFILAFVPSVGPLLIWGPLALYYFSIGQYATAVGVLATGLVLLIGIEFIFYTRFVGFRSHIHPFIMLIGVLGGIMVFGIFGFIIGPLLLANTIMLIEESIASEETQSKKTKF